MLIGHKHHHLGQDKFFDNTRWVAALVVVFGICTPLVAQQLHAQNLADEDACKSNPPLTISLEACTRLVDSGSTTASTRVQARMNRAWLFLVGGDKRHALIDLDRAIELDPKLGAAYANRATIELGRGDTDSAIRDLTRAIELEPNYGGNYGNRGEAYRVVGKFSLAIADFDKALQLRPNHPMTLERRSRAYEAAGQTARAIADVNEAIRLEPQRAEPRIARAHLFGLERKYSDALLDLAEAIKQSPYNADAYLERGIILEEIGRRDEAIEAYRRAYGMNPRLSRAKEGLDRLGAAP
jgi:tetratricopeptide (TPR) repeat protein